MLVLGVDGSSCNLFDILLVTGLDMEIEGISLFGVANGSAGDGCSCGGSAAHDVSASLQQTRHALQPSNIMHSI